MKILFKDGECGGEAESTFWKSQDSHFKERTSEIFISTFSAPGRRRGQVVESKGAHKIPRYDGLCKKGNKVPTPRVRHRRARNEGGWNEHVRRRSNEQPLSDNVDQTGCRAAMADAGIDSKPARNIWRVIAALLKLGELDFVDAQRRQREKSKVAPTSRTTYDEVTKYST